MFPLYGQFWDIMLELGAFENYLNTTEKYLSVIDHVEWKRASEKLYKNGVITDPVELDQIHTEHWILISEIIPRFFRNPLILSLYGIFESAILDIASYLQTKKGLVVKINDLRGSFLARARMYFDHILNFPLCPEAKTWEDIETFVLLRNAMAHSNGRLDALKEDTRKKIIELQKPDIGISILPDCFLISEDYLRRTYTLVDSVLTELVRRVSLEYPPTE